MAKANLVAVAVQSRIAGKDQVISYEAAQRCLEMNYLESVLSEIDNLCLVEAKRYLARSIRMMQTAALLGGVAADWQDKAIVRALEARIAELERGALLSRFH